MTKDYDSTDRQTDRRTAREEHRFIERSATTPLAQTMSHRVAVTFHPLLLSLERAGGSSEGIQVECRYQQETHASVCRRKRARVQELKDELTTIERTGAQQAAGW